MKVSTTAPSLFIKQTAQSISLNEKDTPRSVGAFIYDALLTQHLARSWLFFRPK